MRAVSITTVGNLASDPELRFTPTGVGVCKFTVVFNPSRWDATAGKFADGEPSYYRVTAWRQLGENIAECLRKGDRVIVTGTLAERAWEDKDGNKRSSWDITADAVGPDLTWATASVKKLTRNGAPGDDEWSAASRTRPAAAVAPEADPFGTDAEPPK